ncbi:MAG: glucosaminidase domain-containing protein [Flammeovirgaceae bacterium]|nr:glucosaminidase domain-containing protein [Flammeovirgaceae bacterium]
MNNKKYTLPLITYKSNPITVGTRGRSAYIEYNGGQNAFVLDSRWLMIIAITLFLNNTGHFVEVNIYDRPKQSMTVAEEIKTLEEDLDFDSHFKTVNAEDFRSKFIKEKLKLIYQFTTHNNVSRVDQLDDKSLLEMNRSISNLFTEVVLTQLEVQPHVWKYFTDTEDLYKLETALMEQAKFNVPASIKLAQSALESSYGRRVENNNYFGIKDKSGKTEAQVTTEYYNKKEVERNKHKIISKKRLKVNGQELYVCRVKDKFEQYASPWHSFRAHSVFLVNNKRYAPLFTGGKRYQDWAEKIGSVKDGGVGYATSPVYGNLLKSIIKRYHLDLLDH